MKLVRTNRERTREKDLSEDLESMYRRAAELEKHNGTGPVDELDEHYRTLKLDPSASMEEVKQAYVHLVSAWDPDRFAGNPEWKERAEAKLTEIRKAYDEILSGQDKDFKEEPRETPKKAFENPIPKAESKRQRTPRRYKIAILAAVITLLFGIFIWPTPYHHDTITAGDRTYPVRMNRITGEMAFLDGGKWNPMSVLRLETFSSTPGVKPPDIAPKTLALTPPPQAQGVQKPEGLVAPATPEAPQKTAPIAPTESAKKDASVTAKDRPFAIQIRAIRDGERARAIVNELKQSGMDGHLETVTIKGDGVWYRILVGHFATKEEALKQLQGGLLSSQYPGSFVQKVKR